MSVTGSWKENYAKLKLNKSGFLHPTAQHENSGLWQYSCIFYPCSFIHAALHKEKEAAVSSLSSVRSDRPSHVFAVPTSSAYGAYL